MKILVVNAGSSSLKYQLFDMDKHLVLAKGLCEKIGIGGAITHKRPGKEPYKAAVELKDHNDAIALVLKLLTDPAWGVIANVDEIDAVGHRVAHGGKIQQSCLVTKEILEYLSSLVDINPLHGPPTIKGINACLRVMPTKPQVIVCDTSFYKTVPEVNYIYALPYEWYTKYQVRRYGFHGTSHRYVVTETAKFLGKPVEDLKIITCHIGNGSSITASAFGKAVDTSMGFTPQEGLIMGTRSGSIDPTIIPFIMKKENLTPEQIENIINKESGLLGVSGISSDCREVNDAANAGNHRAALALDMLVASIKKIIGSYIAEMNGVDAIAFTAGIGENDRTIRARVLSNMDFLGIKFDADTNANCPSGTTAVLSTKDSKVTCLVLPTDEELMIATDTAAVAFPQA